MPGGNLNLAYLCGSVTHQEKCVDGQTFETCASKSGELKQPAVEKLLDFKPTSILNWTLPYIPFSSFPESGMKPFPNRDS
ncbi:uncharacterized [Tachysurus ichikawai]